MLSEGIEVMQVVELAKLKKGVRKSLEVPMVWKDLQYILASTHGHI
jgi:hypothetical protein